MAKIKAKAPVAGKQAWTYNMILVICFFLLFTLTFKITNKRVYMFIRQSLKLNSALYLALLATVVSCGPKIDNSGFIRESELKDTIKIGASNREEVKAVLGSPSSQSSFGDEAWYYISSKKEAYAFFKPDVVEQNVTRITFDNAGVVSKIEHFNKNDAGEFSIAKRTTPTEGHTMGFFEQVLGNIGRFNRPANDSAAPGRRPGG